MTYYIVLENGNQASYTARVLGWPDTFVQGSSRQEVLARIRQKMMTQLQQVEIIPMEIEPPAPVHPWMKFAGMFADDPLFDQVIDHINSYRRELDADPLKDEQLNTNEPS